MPLTTDSRCWPEIVDQLGIFPAARRIQSQRLFLDHHLGETDDGVERGAQFVAHGGEKATLGCIRLLSRGPSQIDRLLLHLAIGDVARHGDDFRLGGPRCIGRLVERPTTHFDPDELDRMVQARFVSARRIPPEAKFDAARFATARGIRKCGEVGRTVGDVDAVEQAVPEQPRYRRAQHRLRRRRDELHRAVAAMARNDVTHVPCQQPISILLDIKQRDSGSRQQFRAEGEPGGIQRRRRDAERHQLAAQHRARNRRRQHVQIPQSDQQRGTSQGQRGCERDHASRRRKRGLERNDDKPDRSKGFDAAGAHRHRHDETRQRQ